MGDGQIEGEAEGYAFAGLRGEVGQHTSVFGGLVENESTLSGLLGAEAEGSGSFHLGLDGLEAEAEARAFAGARAAYASDTSLFGDFAGFGTEAYAEAGASASGNAHLDVGPLGVDTGAGFDVFAGARAGADGEISLFDDNVGTGGVGVRAGVSEADVRWRSGSSGSGRSRSRWRPRSRLRRQPRLRVLAEWAGDGCDRRGRRRRRGLSDVVGDVPVVGGFPERPRGAVVPCSDAHDVREPPGEVKVTILESRAVDEMVAKVVAASSAPGGGGRRALAGRTPHRALDRSRS